MKAVFLLLITLVLGCEADNMIDLRVLGNAEFTKEKWSAASSSEKGEMVASF